MSKLGKNVNVNEEECDSQNRRIKQYLAEGNTITSLESFLLMECGHLASRIDNLHTEGVPVLSERVVREEVKDPITGEVKKKRKFFSAYYLFEGIKKRYNVKDEDVAQLVKTITEERINKL